MLPGHLSYSSISTYLSCAKSWYYRYVAKVQTPTSPELVFGSAFHGTIEHILAAKTAGQPVPDPVEIWGSQWAAQVGSKDIEWGAGSYDDFDATGIRLLSSDAMASFIDGIEVGRDEAGPMIERKIELRVPGVPVPVIGFIDVIAADGVPGDFKTSSKSWSTDKAESEIQPLFYLAALNQAGIRTPLWRFRHYVFVKTQTPKVQVLEHRHSPGQLMWMFGLVRNVWRGIDLEVYPENPTGWKCSPNYCEYWAMCRGRHV